MKEHKLFKVSNIFENDYEFIKDFDWSVPIKDRFYNSMAPYIPKEAIFNERADRDSE